MDIDSSDSEGYEEQLEADEKQPANAICLFCSHKAESAELLFVHKKREHNFDIVQVYNEKALDFYSYLRFINCIRTHHLCPEDAFSLPSTKFEDESFLRPAIADDQLLQIDIEEDLMPEWETLLANNKAVGREEKADLITEERESYLQKLESRLRLSEARAVRAEEALYRAVQDLNHCKAELSHHLLSGTHSPIEAVELSHEDTDYFESYAHYGIHEEMLQDKVRTEAYLDFIKRNNEVFEGKVVLDVGCGTGILSMFAAKAGAKKVFGVDQSEIAYMAMDIVKENGLDDKVVIIRGKAEDLKHRDDIGKVDIIISEWMGYFLLFENMLSTVLFCRDNFLADKGVVYPDNFGLYLIGISDRKFLDKHVYFWDDVYGCKMTCMKSRVHEEAIVDIVPEDAVISNPAEVTIINMLTDTTKAQEFHSKFTLKFTKDGMWTALVGYFDTHFGHGCKNPVTFSTGPSSKPTHWKQTIFLLENEVPVKCGDEINGEIRCRKMEKDHRSLKVDINIEHENILYSTKRSYFLC